MSPRVLRTLDPGLLVDGFVRYKLMRPGGRTDGGCQQYTGASEAEVEEVMGRYRAAAE